MKIDTTHKKLVLVESNTEQNTPLHRNHVYAQTVLIRAPKIQADL